MIQLNEYATKLHQKEIELSWTSEVEARLAKEMCDPTFGERAAKRVIQQEIIDEIAAAVLEKKILPKSQVLLMMKDNKISFKITQIIRGIYF